MIMNNIDVKNTIYQTPETICLTLEDEGLLCMSPGANEGVGFEDWN